MQTFCSSHIYNVSLSGWVNVIGSKSLIQTSNSGKFILSNCLPRTNHFDVSFTNNNNNKNALHVNLISYFDVPTLTLSAISLSNVSKYPLSIQVRHNTSFANLWKLKNTSSSEWFRCVYFFKWKIEATDVHQLFNILILIFIFMVLTHIPYAIPVLPYSRWYICWTLTWLKTPRAPPSQINWAFRGESFCECVASVNSAGRRSEWIWHNSCHMCIGIKSEIRNVKKQLARI